ncbi:MAG: peptidyl-prolyl cis-trans isomerase [Alphaproteobacteria bacterium]
MLQQMRQGIAKVLAYGLFGILILSFALWGTTDFFGSGALQTVVAEVGDSEVSAKEIQRHYDRELNVLRQRGISREQARNLGVLESVLARTVTAKVYDQASSGLGLTVSNEQIVQDIRNQFGQVGSVQFDELLRQSGYTRNEFANMRRVEIPRIQLLESISSGVNGSRKIISNLYRWRTEERSARVFSVAVANTKIPSPSEADLAQYHRENKTQFTAPEYRAVTFVHVDPVSVGKTIKFTDAELKKVYQDRLSEFIEPERRNLLQILVESQEAADKAYDLLKKGSDFLTVAKNIANQDEKATKFGIVAQTDLPTSLADKVFALEKNKFSKPISDTFGKRIFMVTDIVAERARSFESVKETLALDLRRDQAVEDVVRLANKLEDELGKGSSMETAASLIGMLPTKIVAIDLSGRDLSDKPIKDLPSKPFTTTIFNTSVGQDSFLTETATGGFFVVRVDSIKKSSLRPLVSVKRQVRDAWISRKRQGIARANATELVKQIDDGADIASVAKKSRAKVISIGPMIRSAQVENIPPGLISKVFGLKSKGKATFSGTKNGYMVAVLTEIKVADGQSNKQQTDAIQDAVKSGMVSEVLAQLQQAIRAELKVSVNQNALKHFFDRGDNPGYGGNAPRY